jgi:site-specific DNA-methyltransferase (adenine-specific)
VTAALDLFTRMPLGPTETWRIDLNDATEWLSQLSSESVDLVVTDPAYESLEKHRAKGTTTRLKVSDGSSNEWFPIFPNSRFPAFFAEVYRVLQPDSHFYMYCDHETFRVATPMAEAAGFRFWKPLVWTKGSIGMGYHYRSLYEFILFFEKGKRKLHDLGVADVIACPRVRNGYPTEKPVGVSEVLIGQSTEPGALVVDPFAGSASTGEAALKLGRRFAGCDVTEKAVALGSKRLAAVGQSGGGA